MCVCDSLVIAEQRIRDAETILSDHLAIRQPDSALGQDLAFNGDESGSLAANREHGWCYLLEKELTMAKAK